MKLTWRDYISAIGGGGLYLLLCLLLQARGLTSGDSGDLVTAAVTGGNAHPPGYPLYSATGYILNHLQLATPAWRLGLLSSIPHALTIIFIYFFVLKIFKLRLAALLSMLITAGTYTYMLYSISQEVFALFDFFVISILFTGTQFVQTKRYLYWYIFVFLYSLALTHHQLIIFLLPACITGLMTTGTKKNISILVHPKQIFITCILILCGLLPLLYIPLAGRGASMVNWNKPDTVKGFIRLVTRADYGTFQSGGMYGQLPVHRFLNLKAYAQFLQENLTWVGILFACIGMYIAWRRNRTATRILIMALLFLGPVFIFYASFIIVNDFMVGTFERFLLPSIIILSLFAGIGLHQSAETLLNIVRKGIHHRSLYSIILPVIGILVLLYPVSLFVSSFLKVRGLTTDMTITDVGYDIVSQVKPNAIILLNRDTTLFSAQYVRYALHVRPDTKVIHAGRLITEDYPVIISRSFPDIRVPPLSEDIFKEFIEKNKDTFPIYTNTKYSIPVGLFWVPKGLLYELMSEKDLPSMDELIAENNRIVSQYHDPSAGVLQMYRHRMYVDALDVYAQAFQRIGLVLLQGGKIQEAEMYFDKSIKLHGDSSVADGYMYKGVVQFYKGNCSDAISLFNSSKQYDTSPDNSERDQYEIATYRECFKDEKKATSLMEQYKKKNESNLVPLNEFK